MAKRLITSALPYVNNVPHLGNIIGCVLSADVFARYCRSKGYETLFICGTDEHGTATETKAMEEGISPQEICDKYYKIHKDIYEWFNIKFDDFGRTTNKYHKEITQDIFLKLNKNGFITEEIVEQMYCPKCETFRADRFVEGTCPHCGYERARGDQCDNCQKLLNAPDLKNPRCKVCGSTPEVKESEHLFLDLPKLKDKLLDWINVRSKDGGWSNNALTMTQSWIKDGVKKRCISRDLKWGVPIPLEKYKDKVFYVWFDAPIGYISITKNAIKDWEKWWKDDENVRLYQFMGKDNIPFHTIIFPASLIGSGDPWTMLFRISSTEYLNYESGKFSKSNNEGVFGDNVQDTGLPPDVFRYYLLSNRPEKSDSVFSWEDFRDKINNELVANLGNLINRTITFTNKFLDATIPKPKKADKENKIADDFERLYKKISDDLEAVELKEALKKIMHICKISNQYFQESEPWKTIKEDPDKAKTSMWMLNNIIKDIAILIEPYLPDTSNKIFKQLGINNKTWEDLGKATVEPGHKINTQELLFKKIEQKEINLWKEKFGKKKEDNKFPLNLKVAKILEAEDHPEADRLFVLQIDIGEKRQLVAGLRKHYKKEDLIGKNIVVVSNLKPAKLRGKTSQGMLLAGEDKNGVKLIESKGADPGDIVYVEGMENNESEIDFDEFKRLELKVKKGKVFYNNNSLKTKKGEIACDVNDGSKIG